MAVTTCELKWLKALLLSLGVGHTKPMQLSCDSQSTLHIAKNPVFHDRTKHIKVDCHFVREKIKSGLINPSYIRSFDQLAGIFTKPLGGDAYKRILGKLGVIEISIPPPT